jgi:hypothetical protein
MLVAGMGLQTGEPGFFKAHVIIIIEIVQTDNRLAFFEEIHSDMGTYESCGSRDEYGSDCHL